ncbi:hypothetical protein ACH4A8_38845 [Streptomyces vietnamensis]|uniref:hypothetical protein n=1 Tax=Streptomyces vietnamensis TaxID=362257 RepID=UPI0037B9BF60
MPSFVIVTVDGTTYQEGESAALTGALAAIGATGTLVSFEDKGDHVALHYSGDSELCIPAGRIDHIASFA